jgi:pimeloyl-ACP methyl ester carboxylesterase
MAPVERHIETNGIRLRAMVEGTGPLVLMVHGFPESWYSWRWQIGPIAAAGFTACAIDVRGYGGSDKPRPVEAYAMEALVADIAGVIQAFGEGPAVLIGHDWGAPQVWTTALARPDLVRAVAGLSVPYTGPAPAPFIDLVTEAFTKKGRFFYQVYFQEEGVAEAELEADPRASLRKFLYAISGDAPDGTWPIDKVHGDNLLHRLPDPAPFPAWLGKADEDFYVAEFLRSGFRGPLNRYRNHRRDFAYARTLADPVIRQPALFIGGTRDLVLKMLPGIDPIALMAPHFADLRGAHLLDGCGHWTQQERPADVTRLLLDWLRTL